VIGALSCTIGSVDRCLSLISMPCDHWQVFSTNYLVKIDIDILYAIGVSRYKYEVRTVIESRGTSFRVDRSLYSDNLCPVLCKSTGACNRNGICRFVIILAGW
jgi:hypothetical protein